MDEISQPKAPRFPQFNNKWMIASSVLVVLLLASVAFQLGPGITGMSFNEQDAGNKAVSYIKGNFQVEPQIIETGKENGLYYIDMMIEGQKFKMYMSKDGELLFPQVFVLSDTVKQSEQQKQQVPANNIPKSDKPSVELFVMSQCPYGTQMEKGILPVVDVLGDKIDFNLRFVYYAMHGETEVYEELNQYCIQKEQNSKFTDYLTCFLEDGNGERCLTETDIDMTKLDACTKAADTEFAISENLNDQSKWLSGKYPLFNIDKSANEQYKVGGSPTLVINGQQVQANRDSASLLAAVCDAFNNAPEECNTQLSSTSPSTGFGGGTGSDSAAQCG